MKQTAPKQLKLLQKKKRRKNTKIAIIERNLGYGGAINYRKVPRPFCAATTHIVLRSRLLEGNRSLLKSNRKEWVEKLLKAKAKKHFASLYKYSVNSNHIHMLIQFKNRQLQSAFLKDLAGTLARKIKMAFKISKLGKFGIRVPFPN